MANPLDELMGQTKSFFYPDRAPATYQSLVMRRKIAEALLGKRQPYPKNIGEGLAAVGEAIGNRAMLDRLAVDEGEQASKEDKIRGLAPSESYLPPATAPAVQADVASPPPTRAPTPPPPPPPPPSPPPPSLPTQSRGNLSETSMEPVTVTPALSPDVNRFGQPNWLPPWKPSRDLRSSLTPGQIADASQHSPDATLTPPAISALAGAPPLRDDPRRNAIAMADMARQGVVPPDPTIAQALPPGPTVPTVPTAATDEGDPRAAMAQAPYANPVTETDIKPAPDLRPSQEPIPLGTPQEMKHPGPSPTPPPQLGPSNAMRHWSQYMDNPNVSEELRTHAQRQFKLGDEYRKETQTRQFEAYKDQRERWQKKADDYDKFMRESVDRTIKQLGERVGVQKTQAETTTAEQKAAEGQVQAIEGRIYKHDPATGRYADVTPSVAPENIKLTEKQSNELKFLERAVGARQQFGDMKSLTSFKDTALGAIPGAGNYLVTPAYQTQRTAAYRWIAAVLRDESGAAIGKKEYDDKFRQYFPQPGDKPGTLTDKERARQVEESSFLHALGTARPVADQYIKSFNQREAAQNAILPPIRIQDAADIERLRLGQGQKVIFPDGTVRSVKTKQGLHE
jgi:hypothetical protein